MVQLTLNQVLSRVRSIGEAHKQIRKYEQVGLVTDEENEHTRKYPYMGVIFIPSSISGATKKTSFAFTLQFFDLVNQSADAKLNEWDVVSDMVSVAQDIFAQILNPNYSDWFITLDNQLRPVFEGGNDMYAGVELDLTISTVFTANRCQVPSTLVVDNPNDEDMGKPIYTLFYTISGSPAFTLDADSMAGFDVLKGKKVALVILSTQGLFKVSNMPGSTQYTWNNTQMNFGRELQNGEELVVLYRNY